MSYTNTFLVEIGGSPLPQDVAPLLTSALVDDSQRLPDFFELRFRDPHHLVVGKCGATVGAVVKISVAGSQGPPAPLITGEVTALETEFDSGGTFTVVRGYDAAHRFLRGRRTEAFTQMTASDIATKVARRAGLRLGDVTSTTTVYEHFSQAGTTDWELLQQLATDVGFDVTVREGKFGFGPPASASGAPAPGGAGTTDPKVLKLGADLLRVRAVITSAEQVTEVEVRGWDTATKQALTTTKPARTESIALPDVDPQSLGETFGAPRHVATRVPHRTQAEVDGAATALAEAVAGSFAEVDAVCRGGPELRAGTAVTIDGLGSPFDGKYTITTSRHQLDPTSGYTTAISITGTQDRTLLGLAGGVDVASTKPGAVIGVVDDVNDPESTGRVRIRFPWLDDDYVSAWARTVQPGAGKNRGVLVIPEVGDEVLVVFEQGDFRRPYVLGGLYNGVDQPSTQPLPAVDGGSGAVNRRSIVSRRGHRIDLLDKDGTREGVEIASANGALAVILDATGTKVTVRADGTVLIEGSQGITLDASSAALDLKAGRISIAATQGVTVDGGSGPVTVSSTSKLDLKGGSFATLEAGLVRIN